MASFCEENCPIVVTKDDIPGPTDDACNTSGNGFFCKGSYWIYDPTLPGANTAVLGECFRVFLRYGETCVMDEWIEIAKAGVRIETSPPQNITDCCPAGTIWKVPAGNDGRLVDEYFISLNDGVTCRWCKFGPFYYSQVTYGANPGIVAPNATVIALPLDVITQDNLNEWALVGFSASFTAKNSGTYLIQASIEIFIDKSLGVSPAGTLVQVTSSINAGPPFNVLLNRTPFEYAPSANTIELSYISTKVIELQKDDILTFAVQQFGFGGGQVISANGRTFINILQTGCI